MEIKFAQSWEAIRFLMITEREHVGDHLFFFSLFSKEIYRWYLKKRWKALGIQNQQSSPANAINGNSNMNSKFEIQPTNDPLSGRPELTFSVPSDTLDEL